MFLKHLSVRLFVVVVCCARSSDPAMSWYPDTPRFNQIISNFHRTFAYLRTVFRIPVAGQISGRLLILCHKGMIFGSKCVHHKAFGSQAPPEPAGELTLLPQTL